MATDNAARIREHFNLLVDRGKADAADWEEWRTEALSAGTEERRFCNWRGCDCTSDGVAHTFSKWMQRPSKPWVRLLEMAEEIAAAEGLSLPEAFGRVEVTKANRQLCDDYHADSFRTLQPDD